MTVHFLFVTMLEMEKETIAQHHYVCLLIDFYGPLLTAHQRGVLSDYYLEDMSLSEIADNNKVSRQAVYDTLQRGLGQLEDYESKLKQVERHLYFKTELQKLRDTLADIPSAVEAYAQTGHLLDRLQNS